MSAGYFLMCMDCNRGVYLDKPYAVIGRATAGPSYGFSGLGSMDGPHWSPDVSGLSQVEHLLMVHRGHELRVLSEYIERYSETVGFPHDWPSPGGDGGNSEAGFYAETGPPPEPDREAIDLPAGVIEKLRLLTSLG